MLAELAMLALICHPSKKSYAQKEKCTIILVVFIQYELGEWREPGKFIVFECFRYLIDMRTRPAPLAGLPRLKQGEISKHQNKYKELTKSKLPKLTVEYMNLQ